MLPSLKWLLFCSEAASFPLTAAFITAPNKSALSQEEQGAGGYLGEQSGAQAGKWLVLVGSWAARRLLHSPGHGWREKVPGTALLGRLTAPTLFGAYNHGWWCWALGRALLERTFLHAAWDKPSRRWPWNRFHSAQASCRKDQENPFSLTWRAVASPQPASSLPKLAPQPASSHPVAVPEEGLSFHFGAVSGSSLGLRRRSRGWAAVPSQWGWGPLLLQLCPCRRGGDFVQLTHGIGVSRGTSSQPQLCQSHWS